jgi:hypothetical protein
MKYENFLIPVMVVFIFCIFLKIKTKINNRKFFFILLLSLLVIYIPSSPMINHCYYILFVSFLSLLVIVTILLSNMNKKVKIFIIIVLILVYYRSIYLVSSIVCASTKAIITKEKYPDSLLGNIVIDIYKNSGIKVISDFSKLPKNPTIILANYCRDRVENAVTMMVPRKIAILMQSGFKSVKMTNIINKPIYVHGHGKGNFENISKSIKEAYDEGNSIFVYINSPNYFNYLTRYKSGIYHIAKKHGIPITPLAIDYVYTKFGFIPKQNFFIKAGESFYVDNDIYSAKRITRSFHKLAHKNFKKNKFIFN